MALSSTSQGLYIFLAAQQAFSEHYCTRCGTGNTLNWDYHFSFWMWLVRTCCGCLFNRASKFVSM